MSGYDESTAHGPEASRMLRGGSFVLDAPDHVPAVWGAGSAVLWAEGESLILGGPPGVGKTTLAGQLVRARIIGGDVLGYPVMPSRSRVLYLAMDRPRQIARALRRTLGDLPRDVLDERLAVWPGPPVADIAQHPLTLLGYAHQVGADTIVVDSLKDAALGLVNDEVGAGYNRARQLCIAAGVEILELHHLVKNGAGGAQPNNLAGLYGSAWITAGAGSVILLWGASADPIVELTHLKTPADEVGPFRIMHDHAAGQSSIWHATDLLAMVRASGSRGLTAKAAACALYSTDKPTAAEREKARRRLDRLTTSGQVVRHDGDDAQQRAAVWTLTEGLTPPTASVDPHTTPEPSRSALSEHGQTLTEGLTTLTCPTPHVSLPLYREGNEGCATAQETTA